jgi:FtsH-binding integral membrane protein
VTFSLILLAYTGASLVPSSSRPGCSAPWRSRQRHKRDLTGWAFMFMGLSGWSRGVVGIFWQNDAMQFVMGVVGVLVFSGLIAYDTQRLRAMALEVSGEQAGSYAIVGALSLYLDFINLFLSLLRLFGDRRN